MASVVGIPYLLPSDEQKLRESLQQKHQLSDASSNQRNPPKIPVEYHEFFKDVW